MARDYDDTNTGILNREDDKRHDRSPDWWGKINVEGREYRIVAWEKEGRYGTFLSIVVSDPDEQRGGGGGYRRDDRRDDRRESRGGDRRGRDYDQRPTRGGDRGRGGYDRRDDRRGPPPPERGDPGPTFDDDIPF